MSKKMVKKTKVKFRNFLIFLLILGGIGYFIYFYINIPVKNTIVEGTNYLTDDYILVLADIKDYPEYYKNSVHKMKKSILKSPYINKAEVSREFFHKIRIKIEENKPLYYLASNNFVYFNNKKSILMDTGVANYRIPRVINDIPEDKTDRFINAMNKINNDTLSRISDIKYDPIELDDERLMVYMDDGNVIYITITKISKINYYNTIVEQLEGRKGYLYLDNGNHFQIME